MSELLKAKQRLLFRSNSIREQPSFQNQIKLFKKTGGTSSIPKFIQESGQKIYVENLDDPDVNDQDYFNIQVKISSPMFAKTERIGAGTADRRNDSFSEAENFTNLLHSHRHRRNTQHCEKQHININQSRDMTFTNQEQSVYNQSPQRIVKNSVHNDKFNIFIAKVPYRRALSPFKPKQCSLQHLNRQIQQVEDKNQLYTDQMFPPRFTTIFNKKYMYLEQGLRLQRISKIYQGSQISLIKYCEPTLLISGKYTSPALFSTLIILSQDPNRILNILGSQNYNQIGFYYVHICKDGIWRYITIDDFLPVKIMARRSLLFLHTHPKNGWYQFWPSVIQKALAKVYGTYQDIFLTAYRGVKELFQNLTGYPVSEYRINKDFRTFLVVIDTAIKKKQVVVLQSIFEEYHQTAHLKGLQPYQSYQIIEVKKNYVVLRNIAEKELITKLTFEQAMIFSRILIFRCQSGFHYISRPLRHKKRCFSVVKVTVPQNTRCYWDIWENSEVYFKNHIGSHIQYRKSKYTIYLKKQNEREISVYDSAQDSMQNQEQFRIISESGRDVQMKKGTYYLQIHLCQLRQQDFVLSYYGEHSLQLERVKNFAQWEGQCECE